ncbi:MAG: GNAT family N-acetyltransferase [Gammaproteobacteria bacterium]|nr:GNAT family N-acetyltransferase [Gammaproteobacteria bacterium]
MIEIIQADLHNQSHASALLELLNGYAMDPMGGGEPLSEYTRQNLITALQQREDAVVVLAFVDNRPAGLIICFEGFSTFACRPLLNIHDVTVANEFRGMGLSTRMLEKVAAIAIQQGCCKLTLEVLENNTIAQASYIKSGFRAYQLDPSMGRALFWEKKLTP